MRTMTIAALLAALIIFSGCETPGLPTYPVQGQVQFEDGTPVRSGYVETISREHRVNARGKIQRDGSFELTTFHEADGAVAGPHDVIVVQFLGSEKASQINHDHGEVVSTRFADYAQSGLSMNVHEQQDNHCVLTVSKARH
ncbi:carboxypeptidase regulatory-like domain-containing protein [Blastopirellula marina]|uniref:Carboxypeptidase regulatory-like domain-containing protein n=1 Tax=Blastopirellula marina TaxID=124 RepID=A0A2S8F560_9BACT|nr:MULTISPECIES: carboxypeptidase regulatory-like domain-containing protein [Pirellulaceae]PQO27289.1 carboxypeptidase regulatory-like domain-containing protein [Blastopirellula marina]RCS47826.1 carboxypeptidase regulatory-like domain-containing protein [Bremerella cremea]